MDLNHHHHNNNHPSRKPTITIQDSFFDRRPRDFSPMASLSEPPSRRSSQSFSSDYTTPVSPALSSNGHQRMSSASTTISSAPTIPDAPDASSFVKKSAPALPDVAEDPLERDGASDVARQPAMSFDFASRWSHDVPAERAALTSFYFESYCGRDSDFFSDSEAPPVPPHSKRRRSGESPMRSLTDRVLTRFPSLSRRRPHKPTSIATASEPRSGVTSPASPAARSRSNSRARSMFRPSGAVSEDEHADVAQPHNGIGTIAEDETDDGDDDDGFASSQPRDTDAESTSGRSEKVTRVSTPLLPHLMGDARADDLGDDALQSPTVAPPTNQLASMSLSAPATKPHTTDMASPTLSAQPSLSGMHHSHLSAHTASSSEARPSWSLEESSEWSQLLGHADFHIEPSPYMPRNCTRESCQQLLGEWKLARRHFSKHLCHTSFHYGNSSKTFRLTQEKWEWLDSVWRQNYVRARATAIKNGEEPVTGRPQEAAPVMQVPSMGDKFPRPGDGGVVGPMEQAQAAPGSGLARRASKKRALMSKIGSLRRRGRSTSAV